MTSSRSRAFSRRPRQVLACAGLVLSVPATGGCSREATPEECRDLLDRYVELLLRQDNPEIPATEVALKKDLAREKAARDQAFLACPKEVGLRALHCALQAPNVDEFEKCLE